MLTLTAALLLIQLDPLDKALETGRKENKPVLGFFHRNDWQGEAKIGKAIRETLGKAADQLIIGRANVQETPELMKQYPQLERQDGAILVLDPFEAATADRALAGGDKASSESPEGLKKAVEAGLASWRERADARAAIQAMWDALKKKDLEGFKKSVWQAQLPGGGDLKKPFEDGSKMIAKWTRIEFKHVALGNLGKMKAQDDKVTAAWKVSFDMRDEAGNKDGTSFKVVCRDGKSFAVWEE